MTMANIRNMDKNDKICRGKKNIVISGTLVADEYHRKSKDEAKWRKQIYKDLKKGSSD